MARKPQRDGEISLCQFGGREMRERIEDTIRVVAGVVVHGEHVTDHRRMWK
ncbi:MAG TPA: hypothetical protein VIG36_03535 [Methylocystis sp.]